MGNFVCAKCGFRFEAEKMKRCPFCGEKKIEKEKAAEELLDSVGEE